MIYLAFAGSVLLTFLAGVGAENFSHSHQVGGAVAFGLLSINLMILAAAVHMKKD